MQKTNANAIPKKTREPKSVDPSSTSATVAPCFCVGYSEQEVFNMIQDAAYYIAAKNGFMGDPCEYWFEAEAQIRGKLYC